jgi:nicotinic acid phosphoribosyltransferase
MDQVTKQCDRVVAILSYNYIYIVNIVLKEKAIDKLHTEKTFFFSYHYIQLFHKFLMECCVSVMPQLDRLNEYELRVHVDKFENNNCRIIQVTDKITILVKILKTAV